MANARDVHTSQRFGKVAKEVELLINSFLSDGEEN